MSQRPQFCPRCKTAFSPDRGAKPAVCLTCGWSQSLTPGRPRQSGVKPVAATSPVLKAQPFTPPPGTSPAAVSRSNRLPIAAVGAGLVLLLGLVIGLVILGSMGDSKEPVAQGNPPASEERTIDTPPPSIKPPPKQNVPGSSDPVIPKEKPPVKPPEVPPTTVPQDPEVGPQPPQPPIGPPQRPNDPPQTKPDPQPADPPQPKPDPVVPANPPGKPPVVLLPLEPPNTDKGNLLPPESVSDLKTEVTTFKVGTKGKRQRIAVTASGWDNLGSLLSKLGSGYPFEQINALQLVDPTFAAQYNVIFINCAPEPLNADPRIYSTLRSYVQNGGIIYASDLRYHDLAKIFPEYVVSRAGVNDLHGDVSAIVADEGLKRVLGPKINLHFDLDHCPAAFNPQKAKVYLYTYQKNFLSGKIIGVPLLTRFAFGKGQVIYTSFHNSKQLSDTETKLLMSIVFSTINTEVEIKSWEMLKGKGYTAKESKNLALSQGYSLAKQTLKHDGKGKLAFTLGFRDEGAKLRLQIIAPDGKIIQHTDSSSFLLEIDDPPAGDWQYSVTAVEAPYDNFSFSLIAAHKASK